MRLLMYPLYLAPVAVYTHIYATKEVLIDCVTPFVKQTFRNRAVIATESGTQTLTVPVIHNGVQSMRDVRISEHGNWRHQHWNAILSAYRKSPFFDYYADDFAHFYEEKDGFLWDFNMRLHNVVCELLGLERPVNEDVSIPSTDVVDIRKFAEPESVNSSSVSIPYYQVFKERNGFIPNLSIADLLFNMGPEGLLVLAQQQNLLGTSCSLI